jgi:murein DD-endopeptidase MepM/ murein hydrolase activator NlpD
VTELNSRRAVREFERSRANRRRMRPSDVRKAERAVVRGAAKARPKSAGSRFFSLIAMLFAGALLIGTTIPANAFLTAAQVKPGTPVTEILEPQTLAVDPDATGITATRDAFTAMSWAEVLTLKYGNRSYEYTATMGSVRWPFPFASPISDGYGERVAPCYGCSTFHNGVDFTPGGGSPIYAIADGVIEYAEVSDVGFGNHVILKSEINGHVVESLYAHMQMNSSPLHIGDVVKVGDFVGLVGQTGVATGNHLHFEIKVDGQYVDPFAWLTANAN